MDHSLVDSYRSVGVINIVVFGYVLFLIKYLDREYVISVFRSNVPEIRNVLRYPRVAFYKSEAVFVVYLAHVIPASVVMNIIVVYGFKRGSLNEYRTLLDIYSTVIVLDIIVFGNVFICLVENSYDDLVQNRSRSVILGGNEGYDDLVMLNVFVVKDLIRSIFAVAPILELVDNSVVNLLDSRC